MINSEVKSWNSTLALMDMRHVSVHVGELHLKATLATLSRPKKRPWRLLGPLAAILVLSLFAVLPGDKELPDPNFYHVQLDIGPMWVHYKGKVERMMDLPATAEVGDAYHDAKGTLWVYMPGANPMPWYDP